MTTWLNNGSGRWPARAATDARIGTSIGARIKTRIKAVYAGLALVNIAAWAWAWAALAGSPALLGTALLAYAFGLRHALDPDHIAAIDNVTRKLVGDGQRPIGTGLYFALGHASVVVLGVLLIAVATQALRERFDHYRELGATIGTCVSTLFLLLIATMNTIALWRSLRRGAARGGSAPQHGMLARACRPLFALVRSSWLMLPLGFLFGLGFETATEIALLAGAAHQSAAGLSLWTILVFPALFAAGMLAVDTTDGILMLGAYSNAHVAAGRVRRYGVAITAISTAMAYVIGASQALALLRHHAGLAVPWQCGADLLEANLAGIGYLFIAAFALTWLAFAGSARRRA